MKIIEYHGNTNNYMIRHFVEKEDKEKENWQECFNLPKQHASGMEKFKSTNVLIRASCLNEIIEYHSNINNYTIPVLAENKMQREGKLQRVLEFTEAARFWDGEEEEEGSSY